jgi:hypothetical protein
MKPAPTMGGSGGFSGMRIWQGMMPARGEGAGLSHSGLSVFGRALSEEMKTPALGSWPEFG